MSRFSESPSFGSGGGPFWRDPVKVTQTETVCTIICDNDNDKIYFNNIIYKYITINDQSVLL